MQLYAETAAALGGFASGAEGFAAFMVALATAQGDAAGAEGPVVRQTTWQAMRAVADGHPAAFTAWNGLLEGALSAHDRHLELNVTSRLDLGDPEFVWRIRRRRSVRQIER